MQIAIFNYFDSSISIFTLPADIEKRYHEDEDFVLSDYIESLPGYDAYCEWMSGFQGGDISITTGKEAFDRYNLE